MPIFDKMFWVDLETFGLEPETDLIIEAGIVVTDTKLQKIASFEATIWGDLHERRYERLMKDAEAGVKEAQLVADMHHSSHLIGEARAERHSLTTVIGWMRTFLQNHNVTTEDPLCGSSVAFDRGFLKEYMPGIEAMFHYRDVNVSTLKELAGVYMSESVRELAPIPLKKHRVIPDIMDTIAEFRFYKEEFLWVTN